MTFLHRPMGWRSYIALAVTIVAVMAVATILVDVRPKSAIAAGAIAVTSRNIEKYYRQNKHLPADLSVLSALAQDVERTTDAWNRPLHYTIDAEDAFTLTSFGRDGVPGGSGDDTDVITHYRVVEGEVREGLK